MMETVDSIKLANKLDKAVESLQRDSLCIMIQVCMQGIIKSSSIGVLLMCSMAVCNTPRPCLTANWP